MSNKTTQSDFELWQRLVHAHLYGTDNEIAELLAIFLAATVNRAHLLRQALRGPDRITAIFLLRHLSTHELKNLFDELIWLSSFSHGAIQAVRDAILLLPRPWIVQHIEPVVEPVLIIGTYDAYRRILELYSLLDNDLALKLARRALTHDDSDIREAGQEFIDKLQGT